jgi:hypothetical protein
MLLTFLGLATWAWDAQGRSVSKWTVFEETFTSTRSYANPPQEARLQVTFISPTGRTNEAHGFWDGGSRWGVRFSPDELGRWTYNTSCSDPRNSGLHQQSGNFLCTVQSLRSELHRHGKLRVGRGRQSFEYGDRTPFFWTADRVWNGARRATRREWTDYARTRAGQGFNVALWQAAPGEDDRGKTAFEGQEVLELDPAFLRRLDEKVFWLNEAGLVNAIAPYWEMGIPDEDLLPEDQVILLLRQMVGRWDAYHVAWVIAVEADTEGRRAARWRRIGRSVFDRVTHAPVILFVGSNHWAAKAFANEAWVDAIAYSSGDDVSEEASLWLARGPVGTLWMQMPQRPILNLLPAEEAGRSRDGQLIGTRQAMSVLARSLCIAPPAGITYQSRAVAAWDQTVDTNTVAVTGEEMTEWQKSLLLPGAVRVGQIRDFMTAIEFDRLLPASSILRRPSGENPSAAPLSALATPRRNAAVIFIPDGQVAVIPTRGLREGLEGTYLSLVSGEQSPAAGKSVTGGDRYEPPGPGEWLLRFAPPQE